MAAFAPGEYRDRVKKVSIKMQEKGIDTLVVLNEAHMCYLTGYEGFSDYVPQAAILRAGDIDPILIFREIDIHCAYPTVYLDQSRIEWYPESYIGTAARSPWEVIGNRILAVAQGGRIGIELGAKGFSHRDYECLTHALGGRKVEDATPVMPNVTIKKSAAEIKYIQDAARIVDRALTAGADKIAVGVRECDVAATAMECLIRGTSGVGGGPAEVIMSVTPWSQAPHLRWTDRPYERQRQTNLEIAAFVHRYYCPLSRTVYLGTPPERYKYVHEAVLAGFTASLAAVKPGALASDVYRAFIKAFKPSGIRKESRIGYSLGIDASDGAFSLQDDDNTVLEADFVFHLLIGVWEREDSYIFSEAVRVTPSGAATFTEVPRDMMVR
ncbi:M24 family metallopeptidase [Mesorhizobium sp. M5C.F.Cr.IN.023.01.1.1]|uniref:M24 family metallopeptidase n=1 Tax=Mesorhizobium sp. M5C.F.Cr.IN.023.01.1.1 TaxID=2496768 RepID=UPI000FCCB8B8|nr:Xaa-Pro peptidase family protein [Mesorhizobium sp. M5C.F.Cr.IN.023.01.1.1]RUV68590.1 M24 family metallopeptidase [Mesorhizobium sp. M5C.F.Cr.IN.023.01.1.1]